MKKLIVLLIVITASFHVLGQKKSKVDPKDAQIDSLTKVTKNLSLVNDSISGELVKYLGLYNAIKEKVLHHDFDPTRSAFLIDSLQASRDSTIAFLTQKPKSTSTADSVVMLLNENTILKAQIANIQIANEKSNADLTDYELEKIKAVNDLKQLKELLDAKIITPVEFAAQKKKYLDKL